MVVLVYWLLHDISVYGCCEVTDCVSLLLFGITTCGFGMFSGLSWCLDGFGALPTVWI